MVEGRGILIEGSDERQKEVNEMQCYIPAINDFVYAQKNKVKILKRLIFVHIVP